MCINVTTGQGCQAQHNVHLYCINVAQNNINRVRCIGGEQLRAAHERRPGGKTFPCLVEQVVTDERPQQRGAHRDGGDCSQLLRIFIGHTSRKIEQIRPLPEVETHRLPLAVKTHARVQNRRVQCTTYAWEGGAYEMPVVG